MPQWFVIMSFGLFGLLFGSFANVVIWRVPRGESVVSPGSRCPRCEAPIAGYDNIPVVSYLVLRGRCRSCGAPIALRYPAVEAASGVLFALAAWHFPHPVQAGFATVLFWFALVLALIDVEHYRLPNPLVAVLAAVGLVGVALAELGVIAVGLPLVGVTASDWLGHPAVAAALGVAAGAGTTFVLGEAYARARGTTGMGFGDIKFLGALGVFLGLHVLTAIVIASLAGAVFGVVMARRRGESLGAARVPFGAFLAGGALVAATYGPALWAGYLRIVGL